MDAESKITCGRRLANSDIDSAIEVRWHKILDPNQMRKDLGGPVAGTEPDWLSTFSSSGKDFRI